MYLRWAHVLTSSRTGLNTPRASSPNIIKPTTTRPTLQRRATSQPPPRSKVRFNLSPPRSVSPGSDASGASTPSRIRHRRARAAATENGANERALDGYESDDAINDRRRRHSNKDSVHGSRTKDKTKAKDRARSSSPADSESTVDMPDRFDKNGRPLPAGGTRDDNIADTFGGILQGKGGMGKLLRSWGLGGDESDDDERRRDSEGDGRRRRRKRRT